MYQERFAAVLGITRKIRLCGHRGSVTAQNSAVVEDQRTEDLGTGTSDLVGNVDRTAGDRTQNGVLDRLSVIGPPHIPVAGVELSLNERVVCALQDVLFEPCTVLGLEVVGTAGDVRTHAVPHIFVCHAHAVDERIVKVQADRCFDGIGQRLCGPTDRLHAAVMRTHAALEVDLDKVRTAALQKIVELQIELIHTTGLRGRDPSAVGTLHEQIADLGEQGAVGIDAAPITRCGMPHTDRHAVLVHFIDAMRKTVGETARIRLKGIER